MGLSLEVLSQQRAKGRRISDAPPNTFGVWCCGKKKRSVLECTDRFLFSERRVDYATSALAAFRWSIRFSGEETP